MMKRISIESYKALSVPLPASISYMWNMGSLLGMCLMIQIMSGFFLTFHYSSYMEEAFTSVLFICTDVNNGWLIRAIHANGASAFFMCMYMHIGRGLYYKSYNLMMVWMIGIVITLTVMGTAFVGYVLPWGQMSFWGATVISNLLSTFPYIGDDIVKWLWGGFSVSKPTLMRFFSLHFLLPFMIMFMVIMHISSLHYSGSKNPLGISLNSYKVSFHPYFSIKDIVGVLVFLWVFSSVIMISSDLFMDGDNYILANPMNTPVHIQPEWYFLFAYAILRSIPNKLGGVIALFMSILVLAIFPFMNSLFESLISYKSIFWAITVAYSLLTWLGAMPVMFPFDFIGQIVSFFYFFFFLMLSTYFL